MIRWRAVREQSDFGDGGWFACAISIDIVARSSTSIAAATAVATSTVSTIRLVRSVYHQFVVLQNLRHS